jgi:hypothetical protein
LKGYDSTVVGFFAVISINEERKGFHEPENFTHHLSAFIKIAQLLVMQRAVVAADSGEAEFPGELLDEMQDRFMVSSSHSPMHWALNFALLAVRIEGWWWLVRRRRTNFWLSTSMLLSLDEKLDWFSEFSATCAF